MKQNLILIFLAFLLISGCAEFGAAILGETINQPKD